MKEKKTKNYEPPHIEIIEVEVEKGFATSATVSNWYDGGSLGDYDAE